MLGSFPGERESPGVRHIPPPTPRQLVVPYGFCAVAGQGNVSHTEAGNLLLPDGLVWWGICQPVLQVCWGSAESRTSEGNEQGADG